MSPSASHNPRSAILRRWVDVVTKLALDEIAALSAKKE